MGVNGSTPSGLDVARGFEALTGHTPLRWQERLFEAFARGMIPSAVDLPTGLGKTSVIPIWLLALADIEQSGNRQARLPRRLAYIVNRRTVVDQATEVVEKMRQRLQHPAGAQWSQHEATLNDLALRLRLLAASGAAEAPFAVSTLRGELADNEEWKADPARPAIIIGTIDMIGSKLLFSGYGDGRYGRAHHAGLIGQDALIVHDEAHLTPAFSEMLRSISEEQERSKEPRRVRVMELSATQRGSGGDAFGLLPEDAEDSRTGHVVAQRLDANKSLRLHKCDSTDVVTGLVEKAETHIGTSSKVLIYVRSPEHAQKVADAIKKELGGGAEGRVALLTGTIRGHERDLLVSKNPVYRALLDPDARVAQSVFLVSTSAGEVGIDIDADHMVCDVAPLDSMIQRLGRVNRRGGADRQAHVDVVWTEKDETASDKPLDKAVAATLGVLRNWINANTQADGLLVSPRRLQTLVERLSEQEREAAFSPKPEIPPLTDILLDNWSLTSIDDMPGRPEVAAYLHGLTTDPPETYVAWRKEVRTLRESEVAEQSLVDWFRACRIEVRERLRDRTDRVRKTLEVLLKKHQKRMEKDGQGFDDFAVVLLDERGQAEWSRLSEVVMRPQSDARDPLAYRTVVLPAEAGGLDGHGMLDPEAIDPVDAIDVAEVGQHGRGRERWQHVRTADGREQWRRLLTDEAGMPPPALRERERVPLGQPPEGMEDAGESVDLVLLESPASAALEDPGALRVRQTLDEHTHAIVQHMDRIADRLGFEQAIQNALVSAARWHDRGKDRPVWQRYARNEAYLNQQADAPPLAKSEKYIHARALGGYRHEFGSLLEAMADPEIKKHPERDLILHLIAAHHGWGRPHFEPRAFDRERSTSDNEAAAVEVMQRFGRLQQRLGRWGLAWLESLLRCADALASKPSATATDGAGTSGGREGTPGGVA